YKHRDRTATDVQWALKEFRNLLLEVQEYERSMLYLCLTGTLPIYYRNLQYNIPIQVRIPWSYPYEPPLLLVQPTSNMVIKTSQHVDSRGLFYHPYISYWANQQSSIVGLLHIAKQVFSMQPPVYSKPSQLQP
ncbi:the Tsg101 Uev domain in complex with Fa459 peptide, partial [Rozella allomycis CSF55]